MTAGHGRPLRLAVTGGNGLIARRVIDRAVRQGGDVTSIVLEPAEPADGLEPATSTVVGDAADPAVLASALQGADAVVHLAAIPSPGTYSSAALLTANTVLTATVLESAARCGIRAAVLASSVSALGMVWSSEVMPPLYVPVDEQHPLRPTEPYGLSKECDEATARMAARRWGMSVVALRFPYTQTAAAIADRASDGTQSDSLAKELWGYLDLRDAARAVELSVQACLDGRIAGCEVLNAVADDPILSDPIEVLLAARFPGVPRRQPLGRGAYDLSRAEALIGFRAEHFVARDGIRN